jgi:RNA polymerase sigma factor (sigma-70 family)
LKQFQETVCKASDPGNSLSERHEAFGELVIQFQDMAFACAYAILGDAYLAEDVAQEAFLVAWQKITQLRVAAAFPAWLKRIVLTQCHRLTRSHRLQVVSLETGANLESTNASPDVGPHAEAEKRELLIKVLTAIKALPDNERLVTTLFYVNEYTQADIGEFLEVPVSTVNKRLYSARQRLKGSVVELFRDDLRDRRPSHDTDFASKVNANIRGLTKTDWRAVTSMAMAREQTDVPGNNLWLSRRETFDDSRYIRRQYVAEDAAKQIIGYGCIEQSVYLPRYQLFLVTNPSLLRRGVGDLLLDQLNKDLLEAGAITVSCREYSSQTELVSFLKDRGFVETAILLDSRLDTSEADISSLGSFADLMERQGISVTTLAEERPRNPSCIEKLYQLTTSLWKDDPARGALTPPAYDAKEAQMWLDRPYVLPDAYFIAKVGNRYVGVTDLSLYDAMPGSLTQGFIGVLRSYRARGIGTALMARAIDYARLNNYRTIQSFNRPTQTAIVSLNKRVGFRLHFEHVTLEKCLREVSQVNPKIYERFAGRYQAAENGRISDITVRNEAGKLSAEFIGQKVELFPISASRYFIKYFYGEISFASNKDGEVEELELRMTRAKPEKTIQARKIP